MLHHPYVAPIRIRSDADATCLVVLVLPQHHQVTVVRPPQISAGVFQTQPTTNLDTYPVAGLILDDLSKLQLTQTDAACVVLHGDKLAASIRIVTTEADGE